MTSSIVLSPDDVSPTTASRDVAAGKARRIARGVITYDLDTPIHLLVAAHLFELVGRMMAGAVITDRSATVGGQPVTADDGLRILYVAHPTRKRDLALPGHLISVRTGAGAVELDSPYQHDGLHIASRARALVDNARLSKARASRPARTLTRHEMEEWLDHLAGMLGLERLARLRDQVEQVADALDEPELGQDVSRLIGAAMGTRKDTPVSSPAFAARRDGRPVDRDRVGLFDRLVRHLSQRAPTPLPILTGTESRRAVLPFFDAYFSNFIEGTEFAIDEAVKIVYEGSVPEARPDDAHDVLGTYRLLSDPIEMTTVPDGPEAFLELLKHRHATIMQGRPDKRPGRFKTTSNRFGAVTFVAPEDVIGTLRAGFERFAPLDDPFARAVTTMFIVSEVHPFDDGNGRVARVMMNAELVAAGQHRIVIPTVYRNNYLMGLRGMTTNGHADGLVATLLFAQRWTAQMDWSTIDTARAQLEITNALHDPTEADREGLRLLLPTSV